MIEAEAPHEIRVERDGGWMTILLARPQARNALTGRMMDEIEAALAPFADDRSLRGVTFRGEGGVFCAGGDLKAMRDAGDTAAVEATSRRAGAFFKFVEELPQVTVMLVEGAALAGGLGLACAGDLVVVTGGARLALTETTLGIPPAQIAPLIVARAGPAAARRLMLTAATFDGRAALALGIADFLAEDASGLDAIEAELRASVLRCAPGANAATKALLRAVGSLPRTELIGEAARRFAACLASSEGREGIAAFLERRPPGWAG